MENQDLFKKAFEKIAKIEILKNVAKSALGKGVGGLAKPLSFSASSSLRSTAPHADYLRSIGALGKANPNAGMTLKYKPSTTRKGLSEFSSISETPKTKLTGERGPLKKQ